MIQVNDILNKLTKDSPLDRMVWVGKNYSIADLKRDLKLIKELDNGK